MALFKLNYWLDGDTPLTFRFFGQGDWKEYAAFRLFYQITDVRDDLVYENEIGEAEYYLAVLDPDGDVTYNLLDDLDQRVETDLLRELSVLDDSGWNILHIAQEVKTIVASCRILLISSVMHRGRITFHLAKFLITLK